MKEDSQDDTRHLCPSSRPELAECVLFGVAGGSVEAPRVIYLRQAHAVTDELLSLAGPATPPEVFRMAAPCAQHRCKHFDGSKCGLAQRIVELVPPVVESLPRCPIRPRCLWWHQEGADACQRCPQIVTLNDSASAEVRMASDPDHATHTSIGVPGDQPGTRVPRRDNAARTTCR